MVKNLLITFTILLFVLAANAQDITIDKRTVDLTGDTDQFDLYFNATLTNTASTSKNFTWVREEVTMVEGWESAVCDINQCYLSSVNTESFTLAGGESGPLAVHLYPFEIAGEGEVKVTVTEDGNPDNSVSVTFNFVVEQATTSTTNINHSSIKVFPNPTTDFFMINSEDQSISEVVVYSILGKEQKRFDANNRITQYYIGDLANGLFLIQAKDSKGQTISTIKLHKQ